ncbi:MAG: hypothetical protein VX288_04560 [Planctomycetota bacterium]|nr:hypothetical protein [Planctomycetota bacterium]
MSSAPQQEQGTVDESAVRGFLADTASAVKAMKASWLRVALNLKRIRDEELWNYATPACENFEDYAFGVLKLNKYVARRMLKAMDYTSSKRPDMVNDVSDRLERGEEVVVPSYQVVNNLRLAEEKFEGREEEFQALESKVFDEGIGRVTFKREVDGMLPPRTEGPGTMETSVDRVQPEGTPDLDRLIGRLRDIQQELRRLSVSPESSELFSRLLDSLEAEKV